MGKFSDRLKKAYSKERTELGLDSILTFGKYKGETIETVGNIDAKYLDWLVNVQELEVSDEVKEKLYGSHEYNDESVDYTKDLDFWTKASPAAAYDYIKKHDIDVPERDWKRLCNEVQRRGL
jgi:hypothetical protein